MKFRTPEKLGKKQVSAKEMLSITEAEDHPMPDFEQLFTSTERLDLENAFLQSVEELEVGHFDWRVIVNGELSALFVLDQVLSVPLVKRTVRERAFNVLATDVLAYTKELLKKIDQNLGAEIEGLGNLSSTLQLFPELRDEVRLSDETVLKILRELQTIRLEDDWGEEEKILLSLLYIRPDTLPDIRAFARAHWMNKVWITEGMAGVRLVAKSLYRLLEPSYQLSPEERAGWISIVQAINAVPKTQKVVGWSLADYARLAIALAPEPRMLADGTVHLDLRKKKLSKQVELPARPQV